MWTLYLKRQIFLEKSFANDKVVYMYTLFNGLFNGDTESFCYLNKQSVSFFIKEICFLLIWKFEFRFVWYISVCLKDSLWWGKYCVVHGGPGTGTVFFWERELLHSHDRSEDVIPSLLTKCKLSSNRMQIK